MTENERQDFIRTRALQVFAFFAGFAGPAVLALDFAVFHINGYAVLVGLLFVGRLAWFMYRRSRDLDASYFYLQVSPESPWEIKNSVEWLSVGGSVVLVGFFLVMPWLVR